MLVETILQNCGYDVRSAGSGDEAMELWRRHQAGFDLLLTDMVLPDGVTGRQIADQLQMERPGLKVIYSSGFSTDEMAGMGKDWDPGTVFLQKPYSTQTLAETVQGALTEQGSFEEAA